ncbi:hypothetical protein HOP60_09695 [Halomonas daqingensis]|uniref:Tail fiber protein n=1 Tax=Billgrantia desiderata TaxID=52021 RepID=A0ABS9B4W6_9GAMM|nr:hypothetical protein [Halomonas desiderata]MCE8042425.1 hypothetical protein [Halomonas desiderata]MCE8047000.1 hypothetical protein [Halomonas desiderata]
MAQSDLNVANADGATVRSDINSQLEALATQNSGPTAPPVTFPFMRWFDTSNQQLKERNGANTAWRVVAEVVDGELVPYSAGESADARYVGRAADNTFAGANEFSMMPTVNGDPIVESDSNDFGEWTRWADGTQVCTKTDILNGGSISSTNVMGAVFRTNTLRWDYPNPFSDAARPPKPSAHMRFTGGTFQAWSSEIDLLPTYANFIVITATSQSTLQYRIDASAVGRWK